MSMKHIADIFFTKAYLISLTVPQGHYSAVGSSIFMLHYRLEKQLKQNRPN